MIIIGFVVAIMLFSSFAIVFSNSENTLTNVKNNNNLNVKSFTISNPITVKLQNVKNDKNTYLEFYNNFLIYFLSNNTLVILNLTNNQKEITNITYNTTYGSFFYGITEYNKEILVYYEKEISSNSFTVNLYFYNATTLNYINKIIFSGSGSITGGITVNRENIYILSFYYTHIGQYNTNNCEYFDYQNIYLRLEKYNISNSDSSITNSNSLGEFEGCSNTQDPSISISIYTMGNFLYYNSTYIYSGQTTVNRNCFLNLTNYPEFHGISYNTYGEMIYNNSYLNNFNPNFSKNFTNIFISNNITYGSIYNNYYNKTSNSQPKFFNNFRVNDGGNKISFLKANFFKNAYVNNTNYLIYNNNYSYKLYDFDMPYTITNNNLYFINGNNSYAIENISRYEINIKSYNSLSNPIKNYFYYNNNFYYNSNIQFINSNGNYVILPLNYSIYNYNGSYITISSSDFKDIGNALFVYNLSIYYGQLTTNSTSSIKPLDISNYIYPIGIIIFVSFLGAMVYFSKSEGKK